MTTRIYKAETLKVFSEDNHCDVKTWCLFCYKNLSSGSVGRETPSDSRDDKTEEVERFFRLLSRHLATGPERRKELNNLEAVLSSTLVSGGDGGGRLGLCEGCREVVQNFCEAYHRMKVAELEVDAKLWALMTVMTKTDKGDNSVKVEKEQLSGCFLAVENVRSYLLRQCRLKLDNIFPRPLLKRCAAIPYSSSGQTDPVSTTTEMKKYKCPHCPLKFGSAKLLKKHSQRIHLDKLLLTHKTKTTSDEAFVKIVSSVARNMSLKNKCQVCHRHYGRRESVVWHILQEHPQRVSLELRRAQEEVNLLRGVKEAPTAPARPQCKVCGKVFSRRAALPNHLKTHSSEKPFKCSYCDTCFRCWSNKRAHEFRVHPERILANYRAVQTPDLDFRRALFLVFQKLVVSLAKRCYECQCCGKKFRNKADGEYHIVQQHKDRFSQEIRDAQAFSKFVEQSAAAQNAQFECELDPLAGESEEEVEEVLPLGGVGNQEVEVLLPKPLQARTSTACQICSKQFSTRSSLNRHMKVHTGTKPYKCAHCPLQFSERASVTEHEVRYHRSIILESVKDPALSEEQFARVVNSLLDRFMVEKKCGVCQWENFKKVRLEQHVLVSHAQRFCEELKKQQQKLLQDPITPANEEKELPGNEGNQLKFACRYCDLSFNESSKRRAHVQEQHVVQQHPNRFSENIKAYKQQLPRISSVMSTDGFEGVNESLCDDNMEDVESVPIAIFVPKEESHVVDGGGSINAQGEEDLSILGI